MNRHLRALKIPFLSALSAAVVVSTGEPLRAESPAAFVGTASCASSNCHGGVAARKGSNVLQNEYVVWQKQDRHSAAYSVLSNETGKRIAHHLGMADATKEHECLVCHAVTTGASPVRPEFTNEDGIGCEGCHGAAEHYVSAHVTKDATHAGNLQAGMTDLVSLPARASLCLSCHVGDSDHQISHRIMGAGHPRLSFELDTFTEVQPRHWVVDDDYVKRKGAYSGPQAWLIGQLSQAAVSLKLIERAYHEKGALPELTVFSCGACHHSLGDKQSQHQEYGGAPGQLRLNLASLRILSYAMSVLRPETGQQLREALGELGDRVHRGDLDSSLAAVSHILAGVKVVLGKQDLSGEVRAKIAQALIDGGVHETLISYELAEQIAMGLSSLSADKTQPRRLAELYRVLEDVHTFSESRFREQLKKLHS